MFEALGVFLYGLVRGGASIHDEFHAANRREDARKNNRTWYSDRKGRLCNTRTGAPLTKQERREFFQPVKPDPMKKELYLEKVRFEYFKENCYKSYSRYTCEEEYVAIQKIDDLRRYPYKLHGVSLERAKEIQMDRYGKLL